MYKLNIFDKLSVLVILIGSINWGTIGLFNFNLVRIMSIGNPLIERLTYVFIFVAALNLITLIFRCNFIDNDN